MVKKQPVPEDTAEAFINKIAGAVTLGGNNEPKEPASNIELTNKIVDTLFDMPKRKMLGILTKQQITGIKKLDLLNEIIFNGKPSILTHIINNEIDLSVSENGQGREQLVKLSKVDDPIEAQVKGIKRYLG